MNYKNGQNLRKNLNVNLLQIFAFAFHIVGHNKRLHLGSQTLHIPGKKLGILPPKKIVPGQNMVLKRHFWFNFKNFDSFELKIKNWIEWTMKMVKI